MTNDDTTAPSDTTDGEDSTVTEWFGQSVDSDAELAEKLVEEVGEEEAEKKFDEQSKGHDVEAARRGDSIDPELGEAAYHDGDTGHAADVEGD